MKKMEKKVAIKKKKDEDDEAEAAMPPALKEALENTAEAFEEVETSEATLVTESSDDQLESTRASVADWLSNNVFSQK